MDCHVARARQTGGGAKTGEKEKKRPAFRKKRSVFEILTKFQQNMKQFKQKRPKTQNFSKIFPKIRAQNFPKMPEIFPNFKNFSKPKSCMKNELKMMKNELKNRPKTAQKS